jgi:hypothetical protein
LSGLVMRQMQEMECSKYIGSVDKQNRRYKKLGVEWKHRPCSFGFWSTSKSSVRVNQSKGVTDHGSLRFSLQPNFKLEMKQSSSSVEQSTNGGLLQLYLLRISIKFRAGEEQSIFIYSVSCCYLTMSIYYFTPSFPHLILVWPTVQRPWSWWGVNSTL